MRDQPGGQTEQLATHLRVPRGRGRPHVHDHALPAVATVSAHPLEASCQAKAGAS